MEMMEIFIDDLWDDRNWQLSLKGDDPVASYIKYREEHKSITNAAKVDELPAEQQSWLRAT